jgi:hypothetical protein
VFSNFLIVGTQRTGSTALVRALMFHPEIACGDEWTLHVPPHRKFEVTERSLSGNFTDLTPPQQRRIALVFGAQTRWLGFKLLFRSSGIWLFHPRFAPALWLDRFENYLRWLAARPAVHVIHITRQDPVEWLKSKYLADKSGSTAGKVYPENMTIEVPIREALRRLRTKQWIDDRLAKLSRSNPYLHVSYEEFLRSDRSVVERMMKFLGCDAAKLREFDYRKHRRQSRRATRDYIANYDELTAALGVGGAQGT